MSGQQKSQRGRPKNSGDVEVVHPQRDEKVEEIKEYWTEHRITLIAYEAQYIYNKKFSGSKQSEDVVERDCNENQKKGGPEQKTQAKRKGRKKADPQFETGFLFWSGKEEGSEQLRVEELVKGYANLSLLFNEANTDVDDIELRQFVKIMLQLKNQEIVHEFLPLYDLVYKEISKVEFQKVEKEKDRVQVLKAIQKKLHQLIITSDQGKFKKFKEYLKNDLKQTLKLLYVQAYCFLAQKLNFNINEFYAEAFSITLQHNKAGNKKVKE